MGPQRRQATFERRELLTQQPRAAPFHLFDQPMDPELRIHLNQQMNVVGPYLQFYQVGLKL